MVSPERWRDLLIEKIDRMVAAEKPQPPAGITPKPSKKIVKVNMASMAHAFKNVESDKDIEEAVGIFRKYIKDRMDKDTVIKFI